jgi:Tfp pilus assembly protein FimT
MTMRKLLPERLRGITIIELVVTMGVFAILIGVGMPVTIDFVRNYYLKSERDSLVTLLEWARDQSLVNNSQNNHGVKINSTDFTGFIGSSYPTRTQSQDIIYPRSSVLTVSGQTEVVFEALSGRGSPAPTSITISNGQQQYVVTVNQEGRIDW